MVKGIVHDVGAKLSEECFALRITNKNPLCSASYKQQDYDREKLTITALDVGVLLLSATLSMGTRTLASGK